MQTFKKGDLIWARHIDDGMNRYLYVDSDIENEEDDEKIFFKVFTLTNLDLVEVVKGVNEMYMHYQPVLHSESDFPQDFVNLFKEKAAEIKNELFVAETESALTDPEDYRIEIEKHRHTDFLKNLKPLIVGKTINVKIVDPTTGASSEVLMKADELTISYDSKWLNYGTLKVNGNSFQLTKYSSKLGTNYSMLCGNSGSFVCIGSIDAIMYMMNHKMENWEMFKYIEPDKIDETKKEYKDEVGWIKEMAENYIQHF